MKTIIKDRSDKSLTPYFFAGDLRKIDKIGTFPTMIKEYWEGKRKIKSTYKLGAVTKDFIYYLNEQEGDDITGTIMLNMRKELISDNFLASNDLIELVMENKGLKWISKYVKSWQRLAYVDPGKLTPEIKRLLKKIDIDKLSKESQRIYHAYLNDGPVKYTKAEALLAVLSNDLEWEDNSNQFEQIFELMNH